MIEPRPARVFDTKALDAFAASFNLSTADYRVNAWSRERRIAEARNRAGKIAREHPNGPQCGTVFCPDCIEQTMDFDNPTCPYCDEMAIRPGQDCCGQDRCCEAAALANHPNADRASAHLAFVIGRDAQSVGRRNR